MEEDLGLWIHPDDAASRGIRTDSLVILSSLQGSIKRTVRITEGIIPGTVSLNEGLWPELLRSDAGVLDTGGSVNVLSSTEPTLPSLSSRTHTVFVQVSLFNENY
ncbi:molybdopterin dinucleotide binding domain-containing protein [Oceanispirochaeta sp.]|jgi:anaerobic selenocysteine-containing dehydrogenase|uniref:molybdopterin dinucleotide binding domain-containing protein n=1 Tax=Oceanispirochaeta sp. TaxID=2035350 RepID=UPI00260C64B0|nr:molybdopterin dinucleotide binding domain-containing protein [Oceanispirochaeta sp.]MDA3958667.1 hypothetical protein [Oceanispirochaeta sp.]